MRPVKYLANGKADMVGSFEQVYLEIACMDDDVVPGVSTHQEFAPTNILSIVANLTPFSDFNQSPRNMYQCQVRDIMEEKGIAKDLVEPSEIIQSSY